MMMTTKGPPKKDHKLVRQRHDRILQSYRFPIACYGESIRFKLLQDCQGEDALYEKNTIFRVTSSTHQIRHYCLAYRIAHSRHAAKLNFSTFH
jgi:hypothetical protein